MNVFTMVVAIVFMGITGAVLILHQIKSMRRPAKESELELVLQQQVLELEQRVRILERIATDTKKTLKEEIETL